ncbi:MAG: Asp-tRNA(Asn)/Glu-tRNA(Gln) amidotransferase subunit GatA [Calditrichaeota bacterium]|nr:Asp-tRNA(Asn)/Glu-tRNA(Gln) amidotransferase subunit GatA [Calditrichota bacterium]
MNLQNRIKSLCDGEITAVEIVEGYIKNKAIGDDLNVFVNRYDDECLKQANALDQKIKSGKPVGKLAGTVVAIKDNLSYKDHPLTCASRILENNLAVYNADLVQHLLDEDALIIGHTNMDEFAMGSSNENSCYGPVKNPHNTAHVAGGSSGGSAVSVAANLADIAFGSDTGGSIRLPAAFTGTYGMKPTYGRISRRGLVAFGSSLDQIGPFSKTVSDLALVMESVFQYDKKDSTSIHHNMSNFPDYLNKDISGMTIGIPRKLLSDGLDNEIHQRQTDLEKFLVDAGARIIDIELDYVKYNIAVYYILATAEASANLARYDGLRYGHSTHKQISDLHEFYMESRSEGFGEEVKRRILLGTFVLSHGYYDAYYRKAQQVRQLIKSDFDKAFKNCDLILLPSSPQTAFKLGEFSDDPLALYLADTYTAPGNLAGIPGLSFPVGTHSNGLPIGLQILANHFEENKIIRIADYIERHFNTGAN